EIATLLQPWLGEGGLIHDHPLPTLIDVKLKTAHLTDPEDLRRSLTEAAPGTILDDHDQWRQKLGHMAQLVALIGFIILSLIAAASVLIVIFSTRAGLLVHKDSIEILHMIGAHDRYIARQFQNRALRLGAYGAGAGASLSFLTLGAIGFANRGMEDALLPQFHLTWSDWIFLAALPLLAILLTTLTARLTVLRVLRRMI
ncbi:MAG: FtsX-like permease family protein, partial [Alphaproteobacteria bacterium]